MQVSLILARPIKDQTVSNFKSLQKKKKLRVQKMSKLFWVHFAYLMSFNTHDWTRAIFYLKCIQTNFQKYLYNLS